jgi:hypothetical protein
MLVLPTLAPVTKKVVELVLAGMVTLVGALAIEGSATVSVTGMPLAPARSELVTDMVTPLPTPGTIGSGLKARVCAATGVDVDVAVAALVDVAVLVSVGVGVLVATTGVFVGVEVAVLVGVGVEVGVLVLIAVAVGVSVAAGVLVLVAVEARVGVTVDVFVAVGVLVGVGMVPSNDSTAKLLSLRVSATLLSMSANATT